MPVNAVNVKSPLQSALTPSPAAVTAPGRLQRLGAYISDCAKYCFASSAPSPVPDLIEIDDLADDGLGKQKLTSHEIVGAQFQSDLNKGLQSKILPKKISFTFGKDIENQKKGLSERISAFAALIQMSNICGVGKPDHNGIIKPDHLKLLKLANEAVVGTQKLTVWNLFITQYGEEISLFQKIIAALFYWFVYQTSLISNTVETYLNDFIDPIIHDLRDEKSNTRTKFFPTLLENINQFLEADYAAQQDYLDRKDLPGNEKDKKSYRRHAMEKHFGSMEDLCKNLAETLLAKSSSSVPIFRTPQSIPVIGLFFELIEWFVNIIIRKIMQSLLPKTLESIVNSAKSATEPHNLPFKLGITRFLTKSLKDLKKLLKQKEEAAKLELAGLAKADKNESLPKTPRTLPGTEKLLPDVVAQLMKALRIKDLNSLETLGHEIDLIEKGTTPKAFLEKFIDIDKEIEGGIAKGGNILFDHLLDQTQSGKLFFDLLVLASTPFSSGIKDQALLEAEYNAEHAKLNSIASEVFPKLIRAAVNEGVAEQVLGEQSIDARNNQKAFFNNRKIIAKLTFEKLASFSDIMKNKIKSAEKDPFSIESNMEEEISFFLRIMQAFANETKLQIETKEQNKPDATLSTLTNPIYKKAKELQESMIALQALQDQYPVFAKIENKLSDLATLLTDVSAPDCVQKLDKLSKNLSSLIEKLDKPKATVLKEFENQIQRTIKLSKSLADTQKIIDTITALSNPKIMESSSVEPAEGLLQSLYKGQQNTFWNRIPQNYLQAVISKLNDLPEEAQKILKPLIHDGSTLGTNMNQIVAILQKMYQEQTSIKEKNQKELDEIIGALQISTPKQILEFNASKTSAYKKMNSLVDGISGEVAVLKKTIEDTELTPPAETFDPTSGVKWTSAAVSGIACGALSLLGAYFGIGSSLSFGVKALAGIGAVGAGGAVGWKASKTKKFNWAVKEAATYLAQQRVYPKVKDIFDRARDYILDPIVLEAALTRLMKSVIENKKT